MLVLFIPFCITPLNLCMISFKKHLKYICENVAYPLVPSLSILHLYYPILLLPHILCIIYFTQMTIVSSSLLFFSRKKSVVTTYTFFSQSYLLSLYYFNFRFSLYWV